MLVFLIAQHSSSKNPPVVSELPKLPNFAEYFISPSSTITRMTADSRVDFRQLLMMGLQGERDSQFTPAINLSRCHFVFGACVVV